jgi:hypothetical protein
MGGEFYQVVDRAGADRNGNRVGVFQMIANLIDE